MKTFRIKVWTYNSKHQELSKTFRCALSESMDCSDIISVLDNLTHYRVTVSAGLGKHAKRKGILNFAQVCLAVSKVKFTEVITHDVLEYRCEKTHEFKLYLPIHVASIVEVANRVWLGYDYTFFNVKLKGVDDSVLNFSTAKLTALFKLNNLDLRIAVNGYYFVKEHITFVRNDSDYYTVSVMNDVLDRVNTEYKTVVL